MYYHVVLYSYSRIKNATAYPTAPPAYASSAGRSRVPAPVAETVVKAAVELTSVTLDPAKADDARGEVVGGGEDPL